MNVIRSLNTYGLNFAEEERFWVDCKVRFYTPDPKSGTFSDKPDLLFRDDFPWNVFQVMGWEQDERSIDQFCKDSIPDAIQGVLPAVLKNYPQDNLSLQRDFYYDASNFKFSYISPPFHGPGNKEMSLVEFVKAYKRENLDCENAELIVNICRWKERPWWNEDFSFVKN